MPERRAWKVRFSRDFDSVSLHEARHEKYGPVFRTSVFDFQRGKVKFYLREIYVSGAINAFANDFYSNPGSFTVQVKLGGRTAYSKPVNPIGGGSTVGYGVVVVPDKAPNGNDFIRLRFDRKTGGQVFDFIMGGGRPEDIAFSVSRGFLFKEGVTASLPSYVHKKNFTDMVARLRPETERIRRRIADLRAQEARGDCIRPKGGFFVTSACCDTLGKADDCWELQALRAFRDGWLARRQNGAEWIALYYRTAPAIVSQIMARSDCNRRFRRLYWVYIVPSALASRLGLNRVVFLIYRRLMWKLETEFGSL